MSTHILVWDIETIPDLRGFAAANGHDGKRMTKSAPRWAISFRSTFITQSFALGL